MRPQNVPKFAEGSSAEGGEDFGSHMEQGRKNRERKSDLQNVPRGGGDGPPRESEKKGKKIKIDGRTCVRQMWAEGEKRERGRRKNEGKGAELGALRIPEMSPIFSDFGDFWGMFWG